MEYHCLICYNVCDPLEDAPDLKSKILSIFCDLHNFNPNLIQEIQDSSGVKFCPSCIDDLQRAQGIIESLRNLQKELEYVKDEVDRKLRSEDSRDLKNITLDILRRKIIDHIDVPASGGNEESSFNFVEAVFEEVEDVKPLVFEASTPMEVNFDEYDPLQVNSDEPDEGIEEPLDPLKLLSPEEKEHLRSECLSNPVILSLERLPQSKSVQNLTPEDGNFIKKEINLNLSVEKNEDLSNKNIQDGGRPICTKCGKTFTQKWSLKVHMRAVHENSKIPCPICSKLLARAYLKDHIAASHDESIPKSVCPHCGKSYKRRKHLVSHIKIQHTTSDGPKLIPCPHEGCGKSFKAPISLKLHVKNIHVKGGRYYHCDLCPRKCISKFRLERHKNLYHYGIKPTIFKPFNCDQCGGKYVSKRRLEAHVNQVHAKNFNHFCETCGKGFWNLRLLKTHQINHSQAFKCDKCEKVFGFLWNLREHEYSHTEERSFQCEMCGKAFKTPSTLKNHVKRVHKDGKNESNSNLSVEMNEDPTNKNKDDQNDEGKPKCAECGKTFAQMWRLKVHMRVVHEKVKEPCPICSKLLARDYLKEHIASHDESKPKPICPHCGKAYTRRNHLLSHIKTQHPSTDDPTKRFPCPYESCGKIFNASINLEVHIKNTHEKDGQETYDCDLCSKKFTSTTRVEKHKKLIHFGVNPRTFLPYKCDQCGGRYDSKRLLETHVNQVHAKNFNHFCETCGKGFWNQDLLRKHQTHHTGAFKCKKCDRKFGHMSKLRDHEFSHSEEKSFQCELCGESFRVPSTLSSHLIRIHKIWRGPKSKKKFPNKDLNAD